MDFKKLAKEQLEREQRMLRFNEQFELAMREERAERNQLLALPSGDSRVQGAIEEVADELLLKCESPIEQKLFVAALRYARSTDDGLACSLDPSAIAWRAGDSTSALFLQQRVGDYRVDFLFATYCKNSKIVAQFAIECNGFAFHNESPEQVAHDCAREREILIAGYPVVRFAGLELSRDADACWRQCLKIASAVGARVRSP